MEKNRKSTPERGYSDIRHFPRMRLIDFLIAGDNPNGKYFVPFGEVSAGLGAIRIHAVYTDSRVLRNCSPNLRLIRNKSCTLVTNYDGILIDDVVPHLYDFLATSAEVKIGLGENFSNVKNN